jgi:hypothetical protein
MSSAGGGAESEVGEGVVHDTRSKADTGRRHLEPVREIDPEENCADGYTASYVISCISKLLLETTLVGTLAFGLTTDLSPEMIGNMSGRNWTVDWSLASTFKWSLEKGKTSSSNVTSREI